MNFKKIMAAVCVCSVISLNAAELETQQGRCISPTAVAAEELVEPGDVCAVCLEGYTAVGFVDTTVLSCGHQFHTTCFSRWYHSDHHSCPVCRCAVVVPGAPHLVHGGRRGWTVVGLSEALSTTKSWWRKLFA